MHEMSLCEGILRIAKNQVAKENITRITKIRVAIGKHAGVSEEALSFCFPIAARGTLAEGAELECVPAPDRDLKVIELDVI